jgi:hypothetical protein
MEYKIILWEGMSKEDFERLINQFASMGWRVVCSIGPFYLIMCRPINAAT